MKHRWWIAAACGLAVTSLAPAFARAAPSQDATFVQDASAASDAEIMMGQLAEQRGLTKSIRTYGAILVRDHTAANKALIPIATSLGLQPATGPAAGDLAMYQKLKTMPAAQFDAAFTQGMIAGHEGAVTLFQGEIASGQAPALKQFAAATLPVIEQHLHIAERLAAMPASHVSGGMGMGGGMSRNPDNSADQLNAKELGALSPS